MPPREEAIPYGSDQEYLDDVLALASLRLHREVLLTRALRGEGRQESFLGLFLTDREVETLLSEIHGVGAPDPRTGAVAAGAVEARLAAHARTVEARVRATPHALPPQRLAEHFGLSNVQSDLILYLFAAEVDQRFGRVYGYLHDDVGRKRLSGALAYRLLGRAVGSLARFRALLHPRSPLVRERLMVVGEEGTGEGLPLMERPLSIEDPVVDLLLGSPRMDRSLTGLLEVVEIPPEPGYRSSVEALRRALPETGGTVALSLTRDADGDLWAATLGEVLGLRVLAMDWRGMEGIDGPRRRTLMDRALREARLHGGLLHLRHLEDAADGALRELAPLLRGVVCLSSRRDRPWSEVGLRVLEVAPPPLSVEARSRHWARALNGGVPVARALATAYPFPVRDMETAVRSSVELSGARDDAELEAAASAACRRLAARRMEGAATRVHTPFRFTDLVLPESTMELLEELVLHHRHSATVLDDWGLARRFHQSRGSSTLFVGPSGTGKTMAASVVANELGLELFRVDLSGVVSKYIGETEKNLERVFDAASRSRVVLFIDEADALFGKRSEVKDAHDRYANIEVSFLLQKMEEYDGIAVLASNLGQNIDEAFLRRIRAVIDFPMPDAPHRLRLWERLHASDAPVHDDVDLPFLAERFELSGGHIRNCILSGAVHAAAAGSPIGMEHLLRAVGREYAKIGRPISRTAFGPWWSAVRKGMT
ncbi:MAG: ATP-binding protein [Gemmatimonadales bacterium]|nr:MAG: ATP-binding protein [Gemmatimonadales bacterium]